MKNSQKGFAIPIIIAVVALLVVGGGAYVYVNQNSYKSKPTLPPTKPVNLNRVSTTTQNGTVVGVSSTTNQSNLDLDKAVKSIRDNITKNGDKPFVDKVFLSYGLYYYGNNKAIISVRELGDPKKRPSYSLYSYNKGKTDLLRRNYFSGLTDGSPEIEPNLNNFLLASVKTGYGDICSFNSNVLYFDLNGDNVKVSESNQSNGCESFDSLSFKNQNDEIFKIEPILSNICSDNNQGEKSVFSGLRAVSKVKTFSLNFITPVDMTCKKNSGDGLYLYDKSISFTDLTYKSLTSFSFNVNIYDIEKEKSEKIKVDFTFDNGLKF